MRSHNNVTMAKKKRPPPTEKRQEIVICPNCQYHFKFTIGPQNSHVVNAVNSLGQLSGTPRMSEMSYSYRKDHVQSWNVLPIKKKEEILIQSIANTGLSNLQKLKRLNDLNRLKKSSYHNEYQKTSFDLNNSSEASLYRSNSYLPLSLQPHQPKSEQQFDVFVRIPPATDRGTSPSREVKLSSSETTNSLSKQLANYVIEIYEQKTLLTRLVEWIETSFKLDNLPYHLKMMIQNYLSIANSRKS